MSLIDEIKTKCWLPALPFFRHRFGKERRPSPTPELSKHELVWYIMGIIQLQPTGVQICSLK